MRALRNGSRKRFTACCDTKSKYVITSCSFSRALVFVSLKALELLSVSSFDFDVTSFARLVRCCLVTDVATTITAITSTVGSGATVSTYSRKVTMEFSGEDDQSNSAGARATGRNLQQQQEWWTQTHFPDDQTQEQDWWNQTHVPSRRVGSRSGVSYGPHLLIRRKPQVNLFNLLLQC